jgi:ferredoxin
MRIDSDTAACVGAGQCVMTAADLFDQDDDGIVVVLSSTPPPGREAAARRAASLCPARAIRVVEEQPA